MSRQLTITINLGNAAMLTPDDAGGALALAADWVRDEAPADHEGSLRGFATRNLYDVNGNYIGYIACKEVRGYK